MSTTNCSFIVSTKYDISTIATGVQGIFINLELFDLNETLSFSTRGAINLTIA